MEPSQTYTMHRFISGNHCGDCCCYCSRGSVVPTLVQDPIAMKTENLGHRLFILKEISCLFAYSIYISQDQSTFLCVCGYVCVRPSGTFEKGNLRRRIVFSITLPPKGGLFCKSFIYLKINSLFCRSRVT